MIKYDFGKNLCMLKPEDFNEWVKKFASVYGYAPIVDFIDALKTNAVNLTVRLSDAEPKYDEHSMGSVNDLKNEILAKWDDEEIRLMLRNIVDFDEGTIERLAGMIRDRLQEDFDDVREQLRSWANTVGVLKLGEYNNDTKTVTLYEKAIRLEAKNKKTSHWSLYEAVFIHELFHAFHYYFATNSDSCDCDVTERCDYTSTVVKEALASRYEFEYCKKCGIRCNLDETWRKTRPWEFPYSAAQYLKTADFFIQVLEKSAYDMDAALRLLMKEDIPEFYNIKNVIITKEIVKSKPTNPPVNATPITVTPVAVSAPSKPSSPKDLLEDFKAYLYEVQGLTEGSIKSYVSWIKGAFAIYLNIHDVFQTVDPDLIGELAARLHAKLTDILMRHEKTKDTPDTIKNRRSALTALIALLDEYDDATSSASAPIGKRYGWIPDYHEPMINGMPASIFEGYESPRTDVMYMLPSNNTVAPTIDVYDKKDLFRIFKSRLITQDRDYSDGTYLPCRVLNKLFSKNKIYKDLIGAVLAKTVFLLDGENKTVLNDIESVSFEGDEVFVNLKGGTKKPLFTEVRIKGQPITYEQLKSRRIRDLSLDHDIPLVKLINENINFYPNMKKLSDRIVAYKNANSDKGYTKSKLATDFMRDEYSKLGIEEEQLLVELCDLYNKVRLTIMLGKYNSSKNKN